MNVNPKYNKWVYIRAAFMWLRTSHTAALVWNVTGVDPLEGKYKQLWYHLLESFHEKDKQR